MRNLTEKEVELVAGGGIWDTVSSWLGAGGSDTDGVTPPEYGGFDGSGSVFISGQMVSYTTGTGDTHYYVDRDHNGSFDTKVVMDSSGNLWADTDGDGAAGTYVGHVS